MAEITFSLPDLFEKAFGYRTQAFEPKFKQVPGKKDKSGNPDYAPGMVGIAYHLPVFVKDPNATASSNNTSDKNTGAGGWYLPHPVISIDSRKTLVETPMVERNGTVKELIGIRDYEISIKGFVISTDNELARQQIEQLRSIYELNVPLSISCSLTDIFLVRPDRRGSDQVVITALSFPAVTGVKNVRPYELKMLSNAPFNLIAI
jgi:hypothetical protein